MANKNKNLLEFENRFMITKKDVLKKIDAIVVEYDMLINNNNDINHSAAYYKICKEMFLDLRKQIIDKEIFFKRDFWRYELVLGGNKLLLTYCYSPNYVYKETKVQIPPLSVEYYTLFRINCKLITINEFAKLYETNEVTVRQWIRRGKLKTAKKIGNEWRIPEYAEIDNRGDIRAIYEWNNKNATVFEGEYVYLNKYDGVNIKRNEDDYSKYLVEYFVKNPNGDGYNKVINKEIMNIKSKEKFEMNLIANENVWACGQSFTLWWMK